MAWSEYNNDQKAARNRRKLLGEILAGQASISDIKLDRKLIAFRDFGTNSDFVFCDGGQMPVEDFYRRASLHRESIIFVEVEVKSRAEYLESIGEKDDQISDEH